MLSSLIRFSLSHRALVIVAAMLLTIWGMYTAVRMPVDVFPDLTAPTVAILTEAPGMAPSDVENLITFPIEVAVNGAAGVRRVRSNTSMGISIVWVEFDWGTEVRAARQIVNERLQVVQAELPEGIRGPTMAPESSIMGEVLIVALESERHTPFELRTMADTTVRRRLLAVSGVAQVTPLGGDVKQYQVVLSPSHLYAYGISASEVALAVAKTNENSTAGVLTAGGQEMLIQGQGRVADLGQIAETVVAVRNDVPILVGQLGEVQIGPALKRGEGSAMAKRAVILAVTKQPHVNTLELTGRLDAALDELIFALPDGMAVRRDLFRQSDFVNASIRNIEQALRDGGLLVVLIVLLFLGNFRASFITLTAIPLSLLTAVLVLQALGATINTMTLGGMAIAIGELVDDAIIDVENVFRRLRQNAAAPAQQKRSALHVVYSASVEIRSSILYATLIVVVVFIPLFFLPDVEGRLLRPLGIAYVVSLFASLAVALTLTPALCSLLLPRSGAVSRQTEPAVARVAKRFYRPLLERLLDRPHTIAATAAACAAASLFGIALLGQRFLPEFKEGALTISAATLAGTSLDESDALALELERVLLEVPEVASVGRVTGRAELSEHAMGVESSELTVLLDMDRAHRLGAPRRTQEEMLEAMRRDLAIVPGMLIEIGQPISHRIDHMLSGTRAAIAVKIFAPEHDTASLERLRELGDAVEVAIEDIPGIVDLVVEQQVEVPLLKVNFNRQAIARHGLQVGDVASEVETAFAGRAVSKVLEGRNAFDLVVRVSDPKRIEEEEIHRLPVATAGGAKVPLAAVARIRHDRGPNTISRENVQRKLVVSCNVAGADVGSVVSEIQKRVAERVPLEAPAYRGYYVQYGGQFESAQSATRRLLILGGGAVLLIGLLLHAAFRSLRDALLVMLNLPLALIGGVAGVFLAGGVLSVASLVGFITLLGIATRNGIMLVSHIRHLQRHEGVADFRSAVVQGSLERLAPILMTALTTGLGLVPLALSGGRTGNEIQTPLAIVVLCGLATATALNMIVVPALFLRWANPRPPVLHGGADDLDAAESPSTEP